MDQVEQDSGAGVASAASDPKGEVELTSAAQDPNGMVGEPAEVHSLREALARAQEEVGASQDRYLRAMADMDNFKKRIERTYADRAEASKKELLRKLLAVKDNLDRAIHYSGSSQSGEGILEGVKLTQYQLQGLLSQEGVQPIEAVGKAFDPHLEEAVQRVDDLSVPDETVVQVVREGYTYGGSVLRPAQVVVSVHEKGA